MVPLENEDGMHRIICPTEIPVSTTARPSDAPYLIPIFRSPSSMNCYDS